MKVKIFVIIFILFYCSFAFSQINSYKCPLPNIPKGCLSDTLLAKNIRAKILFKNGESKDNCSSLKRLYPMAGKQMLELYFFDTIKTTLFIDEVEALEYSNLGPDCQTIIYPIRPAREFYVETVINDTFNVKRAYLEISPFFQYDCYQYKTENNNHFKNIIYGAELLIAPFDNWFGDHFSLPIGLGLLREGDRYRIPVKCELRFLFYSDNNKKNPYKLEYQYSNPCKIRDPRDPKDYISEDSLKKFKNNNCGIIKEANYNEVDSSVIFYPNCYQEKDNLLMCKPYLYFEGGYIFDTKFDGYGKNPSVNPDDYGEYLFGLGVGTTLWNVLEFGLGYRYTRLNVRTKCAACNKYVVNTDIVHSVYLKLGIHIVIW